MVNAFISGSFAYGIPREDSDIDLVVLVTDRNLSMLADLADVESQTVKNSGVGRRGASLRFGKLNLLCMTEADVFQAWKDATEHLESMAPVTRNQAIEHIERELGKQTPEEVEA